MGQISTALGILFIFQLALGVTLTVVLSFLLNPILDAKLKRHADEKEDDYVIFKRFHRANHYAWWAATGKSPRASFDILSVVPK
jgi:hypothetical protein